MSESDSQGTRSCIGALVIAFLFLILFVYIVIDCKDDVRQHWHIEDLQRRIAILEQRK